MTTGIGSAPQGQGDTWPKILKYNYETYGDRRKAMRYKHYGIWQPYTWKDYYLNVKYLALGLRSLGFEPEDQVGDWWCLLNSLHILIIAKIVMLKRKKRILLSLIGLILIFE